MDDQMLNSLLLRIKALEQNSMRYRQGVISSISPLSVQLGGSTTAYTTVKSVSSQILAVNDVVAVTAWGNDLIILGKISDNTTTGVAQLAVAAKTKIAVGNDIWTWPGATGISTAKVTTHGLPVTPIAVSVDFAVGPQGVPVGGYAYGYGASSFSSQGWFSGFSPGAGSTVGFSWIAIG